MGIPSDPGRPSASPAEGPHSSSSHTVEPGGRIYAVGGWSPPGNPGRAARQTRQLEAEHRKTQAAARRAELEALRAELRQQPYLPTRGETGPHAGRPCRRFRLPLDRATSEMLAGAYPFLAEEGLGSAGILDRPGRLVRHSVLLRPVGPVPARRAHQPQHRSWPAKSAAASPPSQSPSPAGASHTDGAFTSPATPKANGPTSPKP